VGREEEGDPAERFLAVMDGAALWNEFVSLMARAYAKGERDRPVTPLWMMLRIYSEVDPIWWTPDSPR